MGAGASGIRAGKAYVELGLDDKTDAGLRSAKARLMAFGATIRNVGLAFTGAATAAAGGFLAAAHTFAKQGDDFAKAAQRIGTTVEAVSALSYAAQLAGTSMDELEAGIKRMQKTIAEASAGSKEAATALAGIGLAAADLAGRDPTEQFTLIAEAISRIQDPAERVAATMKILGKSGTSLLPLMNGGAAGIRQMVDEAGRLGLIMSGGAGKAAEELNDAFDRLRLTLKGAAMAVGEALAPALTELANRAADAIGKISTFVREHKELVLTAVKGVAVIGAIGVALVAAGTALQVATFAASGIVRGFGLLAGAVRIGKAAVVLFGAALSAIGAPAAFAAAAVAGLIAVILLKTEGGKKALQSLGERFGELVKNAREALGAMGAALARGDIKAAAEVLWAGLKLVWATGAAEIEKIFAGMLDRMQSAFIDWGAAFSRMTATLFNKVGKGLDAMMAGMMLGVADLADALGLTGTRDWAIGKTAQGLAGMSQADEDLRKRLAEIEKNRRAAHDARDALSQALVQDAADKLKQAQEALARAEKAARTDPAARKATARWKPGTEVGSAAAAATTGGGTSFGSYNPFALMGKIADPPSARQTAANTGRIVKEVEETNRYLKSTLRFGP